MGSLVVLVLGLWRADDALLTGQPECFVPEGPVVARVEGVVAREGALEVDGRRITTCDGLPDPFPAALARSGDRVWVGFRAAGVFSFENGKFQRVIGVPADGVLSLAAQGDVLWIGLGTRGLWRAENGVAKPFRHGVLGAQGITALHADGGTLHVGAGPWGWWVIEGGKAIRRERGTFAGCFAVIDHAVRPLAPGLRCAEGPAEAASGLPSGHVTALIEHEKSLYIGTFDAGLARWNGVAFARVPGSPKFINALLSWGGTLWIATPRGLYRLDPGGEVRRMPLALPSDHLNALAVDPDDTLWIATSQGLAGLSARGLQVLDRRHGLPGRIVYAVAVAADGALWAGTDGGAARLGPEGLTVFDQTRGTLPHDWVNALLPDKNAMIAGTYDAGVVRLHPDGTAEVLPGFAKAWVNPAGLMRVGRRLVAATLGDGLIFEDGAQRSRLPSADVTGALVFQGQLWVGTRGGLVRFNPLKS